MRADIQSHFHVKSEVDLWQSVQWAKETPARIRVVQTVVGPYGAIDQGRFGTVWFDIGDHLMYVGGSVFPIKPSGMAQIISENQEVETNSE